MEQEKQKKSTFEKEVIVFNVIAIIFMIYMIKSSLFMSGELSDTYRPPSLEELLHQYSINDDITIYEGVNSGSKIKQLVKAVNRSNMYNDGTELVVSINGRTNENQYTFNGDSARKYKVEIEYDNDLVSNINIYKSNTQNETNNINIDYKEFAEIAGTMQEGSIGKVYNTIKKTDGLVSNIIINDIEKEVDNYEINNNYTNTEKNINKSNTHKTYNIDYKSGLIETCIWLPFIVINIVVYCKYKSNAKKMNTNLYDEEEIKRKQKSLLLLLLFTGIVSWLVSYFWLKYLENSILYIYSII